MSPVSWARVAEPAEDLLTLDEVKAHLRVESADEDALIAAYLAAATQWCEEFTSRALVAQSWEIVLDNWPSGNEIGLPRPPLQSVTWVKWVDEEDAENTLDSALYHVDTASTPGRLVLKTGASWPADSLRAAAGISIRFVAGFGAPQDVPPAIRQAARFLVGHFYENRESVVVGSFNPSHVPDTVRALLWPWRVW